jgi:flagellar export protein FliJ
MQRFQFRLDRVLDWRRKQCGMEEIRLAASLAELQITERRIEQLLAERAVIDRELLQRRDIPAAEFLHLSRYRLRADKEEADWVEQRNQRVQAVLEQRARVLQAQQSVKLLEKLRERRLEEHTLEATKETEEAAADSYMVRWSQAPR